MKTAVTVIQVLCGLFLIAVVLLQSGKSAGLSGAIGRRRGYLPVQEQGQDCGRQAGQVDQVGGHRLYAAHPVPELIP